jgi:hypothetical protein
MHGRCLPPLLEGQEAMIQLYHVCILLPSTSALADLSSVLTSQARQWVRLTTESALLVEVPDEAQLIM